MKINIDTTDFTLMEQIQPGDCFLYSGDLYIKAWGLESGFNCNCYKVGFPHGWRCLNDNEKVTPITQLVVKTS